MHCHTRCSDGSLSAAEAALLAAERGVRVLAITDHDSIGGWDQADKVAREVSNVREKALRILPGVEINTAWLDEEIHILGYFDRRFLSGEPQHSLRVPGKIVAFDRTLEVLRHKRVERAQTIVEKLRGLGVGIVWGDVEKLVAGPSVGRSHIARALVERGDVATLHEAFLHYLNAGAAAYVPNYSIKPVDAVKLIRDSGGVAVLAHPKDMKREIISELVGAGLAGLEVWHPDHSAAQIETLERLVQHYGILATGGSDYHGFGLHAELGFFGTDEEAVNRLLQNLAVAYEQV